MACFAGRTLLAALISMIVSPGYADETSPTPGGSFFEAFNSLDVKHRWYTSDGWSNGSYQECVWQAENLSVADGLLFLALKEGAEGAVSTCAELQTRGFYGYGTYEVSMRPVAGSGTVSAFFTYTGPVHGTPHDEIDFEFLGKDPEEVQLNYFVDGKGEHGTIVPAENPDADGFVRLAFEWTETRIRWFVDGKLVRETAPGERLPSTPGKIILSLWNGTSELNDWLGPYVKGNEPLVMAVEWVAYTALGESCRFPASVTCDGATE